MRFEAANISTLTTATADAPLVAIRVPATERAAIREIGVTTTAATVTRLGLARVTTVSVTPGTTKPGRNQIPSGPDSGTLLVSSWGTVPVISTNYLRRMYLSANAGAGYIWTWPPDAPLVVGQGTAIAEIALANLVAVAPAVFEYYVVWED